MNPLDPITTNFDTRVIEIPHLGISMRTLMGVAASATQDYVNSKTHEELTSSLKWRPRFSVLYKGTVIAMLRMKTLDTFLGA